MNYSFSFDEMYLFSKHGMKISSTELYNRLTNNGNTILTKDKLYNFLLNFY